MGTIEHVIMRDDSPLTDLQKEIVQLVADGQHIKQIAAQRSVTSQAISMVIKRAMVTVGSKTRTQLIVQCLRQRWIE